MPPALVIEGIQGSGKSEVLDQCQLSLRRTAAWRWAEDLDARVSFMRNVSPDPDWFFLELSAQLSKGSSFFRPARTPRFRMLHRHLARERGLKPSELPPALTRTADDAAKVGLTAVGGPTWLKPSLVIRLLPRAWAAVSPTSAARWVREYREQLSDSLLPPSVTGARIDGLYRGLGHAMAADVAAMNTRRWLKVGKVIVFVDAYERVEGTNQQRNRFIVDFARTARDIRAPLFLVVGCRKQKLWTRLMETSGQVDRSDTFALNDAVEIHNLYEIGVEERAYELRDMGVPAALCNRLAEASRGVPLAMRLFAQLFGTSNGHLNDWELGMLEEVQAIPMGPDGPDDAWVGAFCAIVGPQLLASLDETLRLHALAAAAPRAFDRPLLAAVLEDRFSADAFDQLIHGPLTHSAGPSPILTTDKSLQVRSFLRDLLANGDVEREALRVWHGRAVRYLQDLATTVGSSEQAGLEIEIVYHSFALDPGDAEDLLNRSFGDAYRAQRLEHCELLLDAAYDAAQYSQSHAAATLALAGRLHAAAGTHALAERRLKQAEELAPSQGDSELEAGIAAALSRVLRRQYRFDEAEDQLLRLEATAGQSDELEFYLRWSGSLIAKGRGDLPEARRLLDLARSALGRALGQAGDADERAATFHLAPMTGRMSHLDRHEADIERRAGNYRATDDLVQRARIASPSTGEAVIVSAYLQILEAELKRVEGMPEVCLALADGAVMNLSQPGTSDEHGAMMGTRCLALAALQSGALDNAAEYADRLIAADPASFMPGRTVGYLVLGEVARLRQEHKSAQHMYGQALEYASAPADPSAPASATLSLFESRYVRMCRAELLRAAGEAGRALREVRYLLEDDLVLGHPTLVFWCHLVAARAAGSPEDARNSLDRCETVLGEIIAPADEETPEHRALQEHHWPLNGEQLPDIRFSFP